MEGGAAVGGPGAPRALAIVGPTATGKTELAARVAEALEGEVISLDSRQAYRGMEVGTAAPSAALRDAVPHHGVAFIEPRERYGAGRFARLARGWIEAIRRRGRVPILAGGTGFFLRALTDPVFREPPMEEARRARLRGWLEGREPEALIAWAGRLDPALARRLPRLDPQRAGRTLELALLSGRPLSWWHDHGEPEAPPVRVLAFSLRLPAAAHRSRIRARARALLEAGWEDEVRRLLEAGHAGAPAFDAVGYGAVAALVEGRLDREAALERIVRETWAYARRQRTWFRHQLPPGATTLDARRPPDELAARVISGWRRAGESGKAPREVDEGREAS